MRPTLSRLFVWYVICAARLWHPNLVAHKYSFKGLGVSQLWESYIEERAPPSLAISTWCLRATMPTTLRDYYLSSPAMCWVPYASPTRTSYCCHLHEAWCRHIKTKAILNFNFKDVESRPLIVEPPQPPLNKNL